MQEGNWAVDLIGIFFQIREKGMTEILDQTKSITKKQIVFYFIYLFSNARIDLAEIFLANSFHFYFIHLFSYAKELGD